MNLPDNISHLLGVDFSGNVVSLDASIFSSTTINQTNVSVADSRIPTADNTASSTSTVTNNIIKQTIENGFVIEASPYFIPLVNSLGNNFANSSIYQSGVKIGINTRAPQYLLDVAGGSINISTTDSVTNYGFKIDGYNIAYKDLVNGLIYFGNDLDLKIASFNTLLLRGLIPTTPLGEDRYLTVNDLGVVSATDEVNASRIRVKVRNSTGSTIYKGMIVYMSGSTGNRPNVSLAKANAESTSARTFGAAYTDIPNNTDGYVVIIGNIQTLDTRTNNPNPFTLDTLVEGDQLYLSPANAGYVTKIKPSAPNHIVYIGKVIRLSPTNGTIEYQIQNGFELDEIHDVQITSKANKDFLYFDSTTGLWKNGQFDSIMAIGGEVSGTYSNIILSEAAILAKKLTGLNTSSGGTIVATDTLIGAFGKLQSQLNSLQGSLIFKGTWNASTNTPTLASGVGVAGNYYVVGVAGNTTIDGNTDWKAKDWIVFNGTTWDKIDNTDSVVSVNGYAGAVSLTTSDVPEAATPVNKYFTDARAVAAMTGAISSVTTTNLAINRALISDGLGKIGVSTVTSTELGYVSGVTSSIQTQLNGKQNVLTNPITGSLTTNYIPKATGATTLGDSVIYESGGSVGIGTTALTGYCLRVSKNITGATIAYGLRQDGVVQSDVTGTVHGFINILNTQATAFTISQYVHYSTGLSTIGAGSAITTQYGFFAGANLTSATNNYGFYGDIANATGRWNLYMSGTAPNYLGGSLGVGTLNSATQLKLSIGGNLTGGVNGYGINVEPSIQSDVTTQYRGYRSSFSTQATAFTLTTAIHYGAYQSTIGAGSAITSQYGFLVDSTLVGAGTNYAFYSGLASGTGRWNIYMNGTANNYLAGSLGIGSTSLTAISLNIQKTITGATTAHGFIQQGQVQSDVTASANGILNSFLTQATTFTLTNYRHFYANQSTIGAGSTVTNQYGFFAESNIVGATNNYGFYGNLPSGTGRWNIYMVGTANNYLAGNLLIGTTVDGGYKLNVTGTAYITSTLTANSIVKIGGTSSQYLMADGSVSTITDAFVTGKLLTGYTTLTGTVSATDTILQAFGRVQAQLNALSGSLIYKGSWNASTNSPTIVSGTGTNGNYYIVSVAGTTTIDGISSWAVGDWIVFNGTVWQKITNQSVTSVNGLTGVVTITTTNITEGTNLYFTNARAIAATLTGYTSGAGAITAADTILTAIQKLNGNIAVLVTGVSSVFGRPGAVVAAEGDYTTTLVTEGTNLYYTQARFDTAFAAKSTTNLSEGTNLYFTTDRARTAIATPSAPLSYDSTTGVFSISQATTTTDGYLSSANWNTFNNKQNALTFGNLAESTSSVLTITGGTSSVIGTGATIQVKQAGSTQSGFLTTTDWNTFNNKVSASRTLTINGISYDLSADRTWTITTGTVGGTGVANYVAKWTAANTLGTGAIYDTGTNVSIGNIPATSYRFNVSNVSGTRFLSIWEPTIGSTGEVGMLVHKGGGLFDQSPFAINASNIILSTGISTRVYITDTAILLGGTTGVTGGGTVQVAGNVNITGNFQVNGVTIGSGGGGVSYLYQLSDVSINSPANGQVLTYSTAAGNKWINSTPSSGGGGITSVFGRVDSAITAQDGDYTLNLLGDVVITGTPSSGQLLQYNGTSWVNATVSTGGSGGKNYLYELLDVSISSPANDQVLTYSTAAGNKWIAKTFVAAPVSMVFGRTGAIAAAEGDYALNLLEDVTITGTPSNGQILQYDGTKWINADNTVTGVSGSGVANYLPKWSNTTTLTNSAIIDDGATITSSRPIYAPAFYESSDLRLKNLLSLDSVKDLTSLVPISYVFKADVESRIRFGYSAQQVRKLMKELCYDDMNGFLSISYTDIHTLKIKQLEDRVEELEKQLKLR